MIRLSAIALALLVLGCVNLPVARVGEPVRLTLTDGAEVEGRLLGTSPDSVAVTGEADEPSPARTVVTRSTVEIAEVDDYVVRSWLRPLNCGLFAGVVGVTIAAVASEDIENDETVPYAAALSTALGTDSFRAHRWRIATLPATAGRDAMSGTSLDTTANEAQPR